MNEKAVFRKLCEQLGYNKQLIKFWIDHKPHLVDELDEATKLVNSVDVTEELIERAMDDFRNSNWKVRKGERPNVLEFAEHILLFYEDHKRTQKELDNVSWRVQMLNSGFTSEQLDEVMYKTEAKRDPRWGTYCT